MQFGQQIAPLTKYIQSPIKIEASNIIHPAAWNTNETKIPQSGICMSNVDNL